MLSATRQRNEDDDAIRNAARQFSCDLVTQSQLHVLFLQTVHAASVSTIRPSAESFRRYADLWLPLLDVYNSRKSKNDVGLVPPLDVAWLWHCHRLAPMRYARHIRDRFHAEQPFEAVPPFSLQHPDTPEKDLIPPETAAQYLWKELYPTEPFFLDERRVDCMDEKLEAEKTDGILNDFDVLESAERQSTFLWQVSSPRFSDVDFLRQGVLNYYRFLCLKGTEKGKNQIIVPTYQIDLMWHTHMLASLHNYNDDCISIIGQTLHHDDSLTDRSQNSILNRAYKKTEALWTTMYGLEYRIEGGMYRGEPPESYFDMYKLEKNDAPTGPYTHLIGKVAASSTGQPQQAPFCGATQWTPLDASSCPDGQPPFIKALPKSKTSGENANPQKACYIFGKGPKGNGYYHTTTRESYQILLRRIQGRKEELASEISCYGCWHASDAHQQSKQKRN